VCGLPANYDASFFVGREVKQVCFSVNTIDVIFDDDVYVSLRGPFVHKRGPEANEEPQSVPVRSSGLMSISGRQVTSAGATTDGTLTLTFDDGQVLICLDDGGYESYEIRNGADRTFV
jgi:hypothetical protein